MSAAEWLTVDWVSIECCQCGCRFQVSKLFQSNKRETKTGFYCPNGHSLVYTESDADKLRRQLATERDRRSFAERRLQSEQDSHRATRGHLTRTKKRNAAGTCLYCKRTFQQLARHMKAKHPEKCEKHAASQ